MTEAKALVIVADGAEELETISVTDILTRGGVKVTIAALKDGKGPFNIKTAHGIALELQTSLQEVKDESFDVVVVPGGYEGSINCQKSALVKEILQKQKAQHKFIAAICAAPGLVLAHQGIITNETATGYPGTTDGIKNLVQDQGVVVDVENKLITGQGPAYAADFASEILSIIKNPEVTKEVRKGMLYKN